MDMRDLIKLVEGTQIEEGDVVDFGAKKAELRPSTFGDIRREKHADEEPIGYQVGDEEGYSIQGDSGDPTGLTSFDVLTPEAAAVVKHQYDCILIPIYADDVEDPEIIDVENLHLKIAR